MDLMEIKKEIEDKKQELSHEVKPVNFLSANVEEQYSKNKAELLNSEEYQNLTKQITERATQAQLNNDMLAIMTEEQKQALAKYALDCEKKKLDYRQKAEKKIILEEVKADVQARKIESLRKRYGYLYKDNEPFIPNKMHNKVREISNWWNGTSDNFKRFVKGSMKIMFWGAVLILVGVLGYNGIKWIIENTQNIPNING